RISLAVNKNHSISSRAGSSPSRFRNRRKEALRRLVRKDQVGIGWESISPSCEDRRAGRTDCLIPGDGMECSYRTLSNRTQTAGNATGWMSTGDQELARLDGEHEKEGAVKLNSTRLEEASPVRGIRQISSQHEEKRGIQKGLAP
ncbi:unnamed protein product, partial [Thlaspi arvense]